MGYEIEWDYIEDNLIDPMAEVSALLVVTPGVCAFLGRPAGVSRVTSLPT